MFSKEQVASDEFLKRKVPASRKSLTFDTTSNQWVSSFESSSDNLQFHLECDTVKC